jgi:hypothetical protein
MVRDGYFDLLINSRCVMDILGLLIIHVIVIMRIYSFFCIYLIIVVKSIHLNISN